MLIETIILSLIQSITEWIPISSTGHLRITEYFLGLELPLFFDLILHIGTLIVTLFFFRSDIKKVIYSIYQWEFTTENGKFVPLIFIGTIPTAIIGFLFSNSISFFFNDLWPISGAYIFCGLILYSSKTGKKKKNNFRYFDAFLIGIAQGIAIIPGISRSGLTIAFALLLGVKKEIAFKFSFLLSIPAIIGGLSLTFYQQVDVLNHVGVDLIEIFVGIIITVIVGYFSLKVLQKILVEKKFHLFAIYCWFLSIILIVLSSLGF
jgi:undecaprenyl-diphosphatase